MNSRLVNITDIKLTGVFFIDELYSQKHAHMLHKHKGILELLYIASGEGRYIVGNREYAVKKGDLVICNADTLHGEAPFQKHEMQTYCCALSGINFDNLPQGYIIRQEQRPIMTLSEYTQLVEQMMISLYKFYQDNDKIFCQQMAITLLMLIVKLLVEHGQDSKFVIEQKNEYLIRKLTSYLDENYTEDISLEKLSRVMHISVSHISHLFKRETGLSPMQFVIHRRIGEAQSLLAETNIPIKEIEERLGFGSSCHLTAMFKKYVGLSPREYRKYFLDKHNAK